MGALSLAQPLQLHLRSCLQHGHVEVWVTPHPPPAILVRVGGPVTPCEVLSWGDALSLSTLGLPCIFPVNILACCRGTGGSAGIGWAGGGMLAGVLPPLSLL